MHEDGNDKSCLQEHENENQGPSEISLNVVIVDHIGKGTEDE
jgi:hypothetical protein